MASVNTISSFKNPKRGFFQLVIVINKFYLKLKRNMTGKTTYIFVISCQIANQDFS